MNERREVPGFEGRDAEMNARMCICSHWREEHYRTADGGFGPCAGCKCRKFDDGKELFDEMERGVAPESERAPLRTSPPFGGELEWPVPAPGYLSASDSRFEVINGALEDCRNTEPGANRVRAAVWVDVYLSLWDSLRSPAAAPVLREESPTENWAVVDFRDKLRRAREPFEDGTIAASVILPLDVADELSRLVDWLASRLQRSEAPPFGGDQARLQSQPAYQVLAKAVEDHLDALIVEDNVAEEVMYARAIEQACAHITDLESRLAASEAATAALRAELTIANGIASVRADRIADLERKLADDAERWQSATLSAEPKIHVVPGSTASPLAVSPSSERTAP